MRLTTALAPAIAALLLTGCVKEELPVPKKPHAQQGMAHIGTDYGAQVWYDLGTNSVVSVNSKMDWDLAFACAPDGWQVRLNSARNMRARRTGQAEIAQATDTASYGSTWKIDLPNGNPDSLAFGDWRAEHPILAVDMGYNAMGLPLGLRKVQVIDVSAGSFQFRTAAMDGSGVQEFTVQKDPARAYVHFSFTSGSTVSIAPPLGAYDLVFTQYTHQFYAPEPYQAYLVTGAVNGFSGARVAQLSGDFASITLGDTLAHPFSTDEDVIGYDWKDYSFDNNGYVIYDDQVYIVQVSEGRFFKLHFTDFYNDQGQRGSPRFELEQLVPE